jgi:SulP family sulfate permease
MIKFSGVSTYTSEIEDEDFGYDLVEAKYEVPKGVSIFEITGPLFFGAAYKLKDAMKYIEQHPKVLIIRMRHVPLIDSTGIQSLQEVSKYLKKNRTKLILSEVNSKQVLKELKDSRLLFAVGKGNVFETLEGALEKAKREVQPSLIH